MELLWGIDLGGTKIEGAVIRQQADGPEVLARKRLPTEQEGGYAHILDQLYLLVEELTTEAGARPERIGIGTPGTYEPGSYVHKNSNTTCLNGKTFFSDLQKKLGVPIAMANDANCFALAEARWGAVPQHVPDAKVVFGIIMGTGVGGGVVVNGKVLHGRHGIAGEWGHSFLHESGGSCYCGHSGCVEKLLSGPALEIFYNQLTGKKRRLKEIMDGASEDPAAQQMLDHLIDYFGKALGPVVNLIDPDAIVIGGGVGNIDLLYTEGPKSVAKHIFNHEFVTPILKPMLGDSAGVFGAAAL
ncbi:MAG: ROK family protein [Saprospirales bacterium]|nr:ROK family protein [Saprospirales bacterium]